MRRNPSRRGGYHTGQYVLISLRGNNMRRCPSIFLLVSAILPGALAAQEPVHVAVEAISVVLDEARLRRIGIDGVVISSGSSATAVAAGRPGGNVLIGGRVGGLDVAAWLDLVRRERVVERESTQRILVLSGSAASVASQQTVFGRFGNSGSVGPTLWVEPVAREDGQVRLRVWTSIGDVRAGPLGMVQQVVSAEGSTELVVQSGMPVVIASTDFNVASRERSVLSRAELSAARSVWIVVRASIVTNAAEAFPMPAGIPEEWLRPSGVPDP